MWSKLKPLVFATTAVLGLTACGQGAPTIVQCTGVATTSGRALISDKPTCDKLANAHAVPVQCSQWQLKNHTYVCADPVVKTTLPNYSANDYVKCYGVAAPAMNDCGTATTACGGTIKTAKDPNAWIAIPGGICSQIKGATLQENQ